MGHFRTEILYTTGDFFTDMKIENLLPLFATKFATNGHAPEPLTTSIQRESVRVASALYDDLVVSIRHAAADRRNTPVLPKKEDVVLLEDGIQKPRWGGLATTKTCILQTRGVANGDDPQVMRLYCAADGNGAIPVAAKLRHDCRLLFVPRRMENDKDEREFFTRLKTVAYDWGLGSNHVSEVRHPWDRSSLRVGYDFGQDLGNELVSSWWWLHQTRAYRNIGVTQSVNGADPPQQYYVYEELGMIPPGGY